MKTDGIYTCGELSVTYGVADSWNCTPETSAISCISHTQKKETKKQRKKGGREGGRNGKYIML